MSAEGIIRAKGAVFLSYASEDGVVAERICAALRAAGIEVWFDQSELRGGDAWDRTIRQQVTSCALFVPIVSAHTQQRDEGYFRLEWKLAVDRSDLMAEDKAFIVPVAIDDTIEATARVPDRFRHAQWTRLPEGNTPPSFVERMRTLLEQKTPSEVPGPALRAAAAVQRPRLRSPRSRLLLPVVAVLFVCGVLAFGVGRLALSGRGTPNAVPLPIPTEPEHRDAAFTPPPHSIAVLPFVNMSGDSKQEYFSDGISEELLNALSRLNDLEVVARTSSFAFKGQNVDVSTIAHKLNVAAVLEGSVRRAGNTVRITVQLINGESGFDIWSATFDRSLTDVLKVQTEVATSVAQQLKIKLVGNEAIKFELGGTRNQDAYDAYLRGAQLGSAAASEVGDNRAELADYDRAIALDPNYAAAYAGRAVVLTYIAFYADTERRPQVQQDALTSAQRAVALAPEFGEAHWALAWTSVGLLDFAGAAREYERALSLAPGIAKVQSNYAWFAAVLGHFEPALTAAKRAVNLDPQSSGSHLMLSYAYYFARRYPEALATIEVAKALNPKQSEINEQLARLLLASGKAEQVRALCETAETPIDADYRRWYLAEAYHALGRDTEAREELRRSQQLDGNAGAYSYATVLSQLGDTAGALNWLNKAVLARDPLLQLARIDWQFDPIRHEPAYQTIIAQLNFPP